MKRINFLKAMAFASLTPSNALMRVLTKKRFFFCNKPSHCIIALRGTTLKKGLEEIQKVVRKIIPKRHWERIFFRFIDFGRIVEIIFLPKSYVKDLHLTALFK